MEMMNKGITYENTKDLFDLVSQAGSLHGDAVFLRWEENGEIFEQTYDEFVRRCHAFAAFIQAQPQPQGRMMHIGLWGISSNEYLASLLGTTIAGCVAVPLDLSYSPKELAAAVRLADIDLMICDADLYDTLRAACAAFPDLRVLVMQGDHEDAESVGTVLNRFDGINAMHTCTPSSPALIVFSSGTTGKRKGVVLTHGNLIDNLFNSEGLFHPEGEVYLNVLPLHHVYCIANDVLWVFCYGRPLCLNQDMNRLIRHMQMFQPSIMFVVPAIAKGLHDYTVAYVRKNPGMTLKEAKDQVLGKRLYKLFCGGGALSPELSAGLGAMGIMAAQGYGMTECSPKITYLDWSRPDKFTSVGRPARRFQVRIADGEIQVKGPSVMQGYYKDPEETANVFTEDGWLKTGDTGYFDEEGFLYLTGRKKNTIVLSNGENIAPEQLEALFADDRIISDVMVYEKDDQLAAQFWPDMRFAKAAGITDIRAAIGQIVDRHNRELPFYKQIRNILVRDTPFPKTTSGKLIRPQYRASTQVRDVPADSRTDTSPGDRMRADLFSAIGSFLDRENLSADENLFNAGLDSLGGILLLSQLEQLGIPMTWEELLAHPTVNEILSFAGKKNLQKEAHPKLDVYPLTNMQIWFAHILKGNTTSNLPFLVRLRSEVHIPRLQEAVKGAIDRHPGIKGEIWKDENGNYGYHRDDSKTAVVTVEELTGQEWAIRQKTLVRPFGYQKGEALYRAVIFLTPDARFLFLDVGHIVSDGMTMTILFQDIERLYAGKEVPYETYTYFDFVLDEQKRNSLGLRSRDISYFMQQMDGLKITRSILTRKDFSGLEKGDFGVLRGVFPRLSRQQVQQFCGSCGISGNILFNAAFNYTVSLFRNEHDSACCTIHSGRTDGRWLRLAGPLFMSCYFRFREQPGETVRDALRRLAEQNRETMKCFVSNLKCDEMFFQYQGDFLRMNRYEQIWQDMIPLQLESQPFHLQIIAGEQGFRYEQRFWKNRFDEAQLKIFLQALETVVLSMMTEQTVSGIRERIPQALLPGTVSLMGKAVRVVNDEGLEQPFGGWGHLMELDMSGWKDSGKTARILPDGSLDFLDESGRTVMIEGLRGRQFTDLAKLEKKLTAVLGSPASCWVGYRPDNTMGLFAQQNDATILSQEQILALITEKE